MLHKSKGKYKWQRKATYSVDWSLSPVILAYLEKLYDTIKDRECIGIPIYYCQKQAEVEGKVYDWGVEIDLDAAHQLRLRDLEELIYVFDSKNEPNIEDYDFTYRAEGGKYTFPMQCSNIVERNRYHNDLEEVWEDRKKAGQELFGKIYQCLDF